MPKQDIIVVGSLRWRRGATHRPEWKERRKSRPHNRLLGVSALHGAQYGSLWSQATVMGAMTVLIQLGIYGGLTLAASRSRYFVISRPSATMFAGRAAGYSSLSSQS
jgi:hypothetical protein